MHTTLLLADHLDKEAGFAGRLFGRLMTRPGGGSRLGLLGYNRLADEYRLISGRLTDLGRLARSKGLSASEIWERNRLRAARSRVLGYMRDAERRLGFAPSATAATNVAEAAKSQAAASAAVKSTHIPSGVTPEQASTVSRLAKTVDTKGVPKSNVTWAAKPQVVPSAAAKPTQAAAGVAAEQAPTTARLAEAVSTKGVPKSPDIFSRTKPLEPVQPHPVAGPDSGKGVTKAQDVFSRVKTTTENPVQTPPVSAPSAESIPATPVSAPSAESIPTTSQIAEWIKKNPRWAAAVGIGTPLAFGTAGYFAGRGSNR